MTIRSRPLPRAWIQSLFALTLLSAAYFAPGGSPESNGTVALLRSLAERGRYDLGELAQATPRRIERDGRSYADQPPGFAFVAWPLYSAIRSLPGGPSRHVYVLSLILVALPTALAAARVAQIAHGHLGAPRGWALGLGCAYGLGSLAWPAATQPCGEQLAAALSLHAFALALPPDDDAPTWRLSGARAVVIGSLLGWSALIEPLSLPVALGVVILLAARIDGAFTLIPLGCALILPLQLATSYAHSCFGDPMALGTRLATAPRAPVAGEALARLAAGSPYLLLLIPAALDRLCLRPMLGHLPSATEVTCWLLVAIGAASVASGLDNRYPWTSGPPAALPFLPYAVLLLHAVRGRWVVLGGVLIGAAAALQLVGLAVDPQLAPERAGELLLRGELAAGRWSFDSEGPGPSPVGWNAGLGLGVARPWSLVPLLALWLIAGTALVAREFGRARRRPMRGFPDSPRGTLP